MNNSPLPFQNLIDKGYSSTGYTFNSKINAEKEARKFRRIGYYARVLKTISNHVYAMCCGDYILMIKRKET
jgi:hypothetical protein